MASPTATNGPDPTTPLWRAAQVYRLLSCVYALGFQIAINSDLRHPALGWLLFAVLTGWSAVCALAYLRGFGRKPAWVIAEIVIVVLLVLSTMAVASRQWELDNQTWPTTLWATNATVSAALRCRCWPPASGSTMCWPQCWLPRWVRACSRSCSSAPSSPGSSPKSGRRWRPSRD